ncbi:MAG: hypothetical protein ACE5DX_01395 [Candidatus Dojkabacteria bacterium]
MRKLPREKSVCLYLSVHVPYLLARFNFFDVDSRVGFNRYFRDWNSDPGRLQRQLTTNFFLINKLFGSLLKEYDNFKLSLSFSGVALEQFREYTPDLLVSFNELVDTGKVEIVSYPYHSPLSWLYSPKEFAEQILLNRKAIWNIFRRKPKVFGNTEFIYNNKLASFIRRLGFEGVLVGSVSKKKLNKGLLYTANPVELDDTAAEAAISFRFKQRAPEKLKILLADDNYSLQDIDAPGETNGKSTNIFYSYGSLSMDLQESKKVLLVLEKRLRKVLDVGTLFRSPSETIAAFDALDALDVRKTRSWIEKGNRLQKEALEEVYQIEAEVSDLAEQLNDRKRRSDLLNTWRCLQQADHFSSMSTTSFNTVTDEEYKSPYESPYDAYINYMNILNDFKSEVGRLKQ